MVNIFFASLREYKKFVFRLNLHPHAVIAFEFSDETPVALWTWSYGDSEPKGRMRAT